MFNNSMPQSSRTSYERRPEVRLKRYIKNHDPSYVEKRTKYANMESVKERRAALNKRRRQLCTILISLAKNGKLCNDHGDKFNITLGRLVQDNHVVKCDKEGNIHKIPYNDMVDLEFNQDLDDPIPTEDDLRFLELKKKYDRGEIKVNKSKKTFDSTSIVQQEDGDQSD